MSLGGTRQHRAGLREHFAKQPLSSGDNYGSGSIIVNSGE